MLGGLCISLVAWSAEAAEARYAVRIGPRPYADALIELGVQANVSVLGTAACGEGGQVGLSGEFPLDEALRRLTRGAPCSFRILDPRTVRILRAPVAAHPAAERPATLFAELLVTATKRPASLNELPASVSVISREQIARTGAADVGDTADQLAGVFTTNLGPGRDKLILRGLSDGAFTGHARSAVGSYLDDTPLNYNAPDPDLRLVDVERIEVIRGPQGALYGSGSLSGVYRMVTRHPDLGRYEAGVSGTAAWTDGGSPSEEIEAYLNAPLLSGAAAVRAVAYHDLQGGYIDNLSLKLPDVDRTVREGGRLAVRLQPAADWQLELAGAGQRLRSEDSHYTTSGSGRDLRVGRVLEGHKNDFSEISLTLRGEFGWGSLRSTAAWVDHAFSSQYDATPALRIFAADTGSLGLYDETTRIRMLVGDSVLRSTGPGPFTWLLGLYASATLEKSPSTLDVRSPLGLLRVYEEHRRDRLREVAVYGETTYAVRPQWTLSAGGRLFTSDVRTRALVLVVEPGTSRAFDSERRFSGFSPKISLQRELPDGGLVYGLFSQGYRPGGFNSGGFLFPIRPGRVSFAPDQLRNYEAGLKLSLMQRRMPLHATVFFDTWSHIQSDEYRPSGLPFTVNVGDARIAGLETEVGYDWDSGLSVQASALLMNARLVDPNLDFARRLASSLPGVPKVSAGLLVSYQHPLPRNLVLRLGAEGSYVGASALSFDAEQAPRMSAYGRAKLTAEVAGRDWSAMLFLSNPGNEAGDTFAYGNPFSFGQVRQSTPQRPRTVGIRLAANY